MLIMFVHGFKLAARPPSHSMKGITIQAYNKALKLFVLCVNQRVAKKSNP